MPAPPTLVSQGIKVPAHTLSPTEAIEQLADGPALRLELADSTPCEAAADSTLTATLYLDTGKVWKQIAGCISDPREPFQSMRPLLDQYRN